jgi:hypothetical protein
MSLVQNQLDRCVSEKGRKFFFHFVFIQKMGIFFNIKHNIRIELLVTHKISVSFPFATKFELKL